MSAEPVRLALVEDHASFRQALEAVLELEPDLEVVGAAGRADDAVAVVRGGRAHVVVVDLDLPGGGGVEALGRLREEVPEAACIVLTALTDEVELGRAVEAGARAVLHKSTEMQDLLEAIRTVATGGLGLDPVVTSAWLRALANARDRDWVSRVTRDSLSPREIEVLELLTAGWSPPEMARRLSISVPTVETHLRNLRVKLDAPSRLDAVLTALRLGLVQPPTPARAGAPVPRIE